MLISADGAWSKAMEWLRVNGSIGFVVSAAIVVVVLVTGVVVYYSLLRRKQETPGDAEAGSLAGGDARASQQDGEPDDEGGTPELTAGRSASGNLVQQFRNDWREAMKKNRLAVFAIIGAALLIAGESILFFTEESPRDVVREVLAEEEIRGHLAEPKATPEKFEEPAVLSPHWRVAIQFVGEVFGVRLGELFLLGCFLEFLLHTDHYADFFLGLVEQAMLGERIVSRLGDNAELWKNVSEVYFSRRFPKIHQQISDTLYSYFPTKHQYYLDNYRVDITIDHVQGDFYSFTREVSYRLIPATGCTNVPFKLQTRTLKRGGDGDLTSGEIQGLSVNGKNLTDQWKFEEVAENGRQYVSLKILEEGFAGSEYKAEFVLKTVQDIQFDPYETFTIVSLINNLRVTVRFPDNLNVEWCDIGVKGKFEDVFAARPERLAAQKREQSPRMKRIDREYRGLIFQKQGYRLTIRKVEAMKRSGDVIGG